MLKITSIAVFTILAAGCASKQPPAELVDARAAYARAQTGPASQANPAGLYDAKKSLDQAERKFNDDGSSDETRNLAYLAQRKTLIAESNARTAIAAQQVQQGEQTINSLRNKELKDAKSTVATQQRTIESERQARQAAEKRAKDALDRLSSFAAVKNDTRGMVITLSGSVLFATDKSELMGTAQERLNQVADALKEVEGRPIMVYGFTDNVGNDTYNVELSRKRAESVRSYLVSRGVRSDIIRSEGRGKSDPVTSNATPEGRANNRRVEIVVGGADGSMPSNPPSSTTSPSNAK